MELVCFAFISPLSCGSYITLVRPAIPIQARFCCESNWFPNPVYSSFAYRRRSLPFQRRKYGAVVTVAMKRRGSSRNGRYEPQDSKPSLLQVPGKLRSVWTNASVAEKIAAVAMLLFGIAIAGSILTTLFHVSLALAFGGISLVLAPFMFVMMLSFTAIAFGLLSVAGVSVFMMGTPFFAATVLAKLAFPIMMLSGGAIFAVSRLITTKPKKKEVEETYEKVSEGEDLDRFDKTLRSRVMGGDKGWNVSLWSLNEVIDELDMIGLGEYRQLFINEKIDGPALLQLRESDINEEFRKCMPLGDRMRLTRLVQELRKRSSRS